MNQIKKIFLIVANFIFALNIYATDEDQAYRAFIHAKGQPSLLNVGKNTTYANNVHRPLPNYKEIGLDYEKAILGHDLFDDKLLSKDKTIACTSCHNGRAGGADGRQFAVGVQGRIGDINAPTVFNSGFNFRQFWDGRAFDLIEQAVGPIENPIEMAHDLNLLIEILQTTDYKERFEKLYVDGLTKENLAHSIAEMERGLITNNSPYERYLKGEKNAMSVEALRGLERFNSYGCNACHNGINMGGNLYHKVLVYPSKSLRDGIFTRSGRIEDKGSVKVPALHNIARSGPYLHDGSIKNLEDIVIMKIEQLSMREINQQDVDDITAYLKSLTGSIPPAIREIFR